MKICPEMDKEIVKLLDMEGMPLSVYAARCIEKLQAENAELRATLSKMETVEKELKARLEKAVELPFENLDKVFILAGEYTKTKQFIPDRIVEGTIVGFGYDIYEWADGNYKFNYRVLVGEDNYIFALEQFNKTLFKTREAAERQREKEREKKIEEAKKKRGK